MVHIVSTNITSSACTESAGVHGQMAKQFFPPLQQDKCHKSHGRLPSSLIYWANLMSKELTHMLIFEGMGEGG